MASTMKRSLCCIERRSKNRNKDVLAGLGVGRAESKRSLSGWGIEGAEHYGVVRRSSERRFVKPRALQNRALRGLLRGLVVCAPGGVKHSSERERDVSAVS